jgi:hypothetical protein
MAESSDPNGGACAHEGLDRGRSPQGVRVAVAVVDKATGELVERASFPQNRDGLRALENALGETVPRASLWAVENSGGLGVGTWQ